MTSKEEKKKIICKIANKKSTKPKMRSDYQSETIKVTPDGMDYQLVN
jgi:hypothetical protein